MTSATEGSTGPNRAERRATARGRSTAERSPVPEPRIAGRVPTKPRGGAIGALRANVPRRTG